MPEQYEVELFKKVSQASGWSFEQLNFTCFARQAEFWPAFRDGRCHVGLGGLLARPELMDEVRWSWSTLRSGFKVVIPASDVEETIDYWAFMDAFTWELWMAIGITCVGMAFIIWGVERWSYSREEKEHSGHKLTLHESFWGTLGWAPGVMFEPIWSKNFSGSLIIFLLAFQVMVLVTLYTGNTIANLTISRIKYNIEGVEDLTGKTVGTPNVQFVDEMAGQVVGIVEGGLANFSKYRFIEKPFPLQSLDDLDVMYAALSAGETQALVLPTVMAEYAVNPRCDLQVVGKQFALVDYAMAFNMDMDFDTIRKLNDNIVVLFYSGDVDIMAQQFLKMPEANCKTRTVIDGSVSISVEQVAGTWIVLAGAIGLAIVFALVRQATLRSAGRVARSAIYQQGVAKVRSGLSRLSGSFSRGRSLSKRRSFTGSAQSSMGRSDPSGSIWTIRENKHSPTKESAAHPARVYSGREGSGVAPDPPVTSL